MVHFPEEILQMIFSHVSCTSDLLQLCLVCKDWYRIIRCDPRSTKHLKLKQNLGRVQHHQFLRAFQHLKVLELHGDDFFLVTSKIKSIQPLLARLESVIVYECSASEAKNKLVFHGKKIWEWDLVFDRVALDPQISIVEFNLDQVLGFIIPDTANLDLAFDLLQMVFGMVNLTHLKVHYPFTSLGSACLHLAARCARLEKLELFGIYLWSPLPTERFIGYNAIKTLKIRHCRLYDLKASMDDLIESFPQVTKLEIDFWSYRNENTDLDNMLTLLEILTSTSLNLTHFDLSFSFQENWMPICQVMKQRIDEYFSKRVSVKISFHLDDYFRESPCRTSFDKSTLDVLKDPFQEAKFFLRKDNRKYVGKSIAFKDPPNYK